jgi:protein-tyrosine phosphatase
MKILMVCLGNICRSPLAEGILKHKAKKGGLNWVVESAGTGGYHTGAPPHHLSQKVAKHNGVDICSQRARLYIKNFILEYDKIYVMDAQNYNDVKRISGNLWDPSKVDLLLNELHPGENRGVQDPYYGTEPGYHEVYNLIEKACDNIIKKYGTKETV